MSFSRSLPLLSAMTSLIATPAHTEESLKSYTVLENRAQIPLLNPTMENIETIKIRLANGIEALIISDPDTKHSAASVAVKAGSWDDPREYPGMAHFVEHVLFMGTKAYPKEADYSQYITDHVGNYNAFTSLNRTVYMFSINHDGFSGALDRLSHFFIDPLLCLSSIERELQAVDQEHAKNIEHEGWRQYMIVKETCNQDHPHSGFSTGNAKTLGGIPQKALQDWYAKHYRPDRIRLFVLSPLPKETLVEMVVQDFSAVPVANEPYTTPIRPSILSEGQKGHMLHIQPVRDVKELSLSWELPQELMHPQGLDAAKLLSYALGSEHEGSLLSQLKKEHLAQGLAASCQKFDDQSAFFSVEIDLTEQGVLAYPAVIERIFEALAQLKQTDLQMTFHEMQQLALLHYQYRTRSNAFEFAMSCGGMLFNEDLASFPEQSLIPQIFDQASLEILFSTCTPKNSLYMLTADPKFSGVQPNRKERWMNAEYSLAALPETQLLAWDQPSVSSDFCTLPPSNPFLPTALTLLKQVSADNSPRVIVADEKAKFYFMQDNQYQVPETAFYLRLHTPLLDGSAKAAVLSDLFCKSFQDQSTDVLYLASSAGLRAAVTPGNPYLQLKLHGFSEKAPKLAGYLFDRLRSNFPSRETFDLYRAKLQSLYANASKELPYVQGMEISQNIFYTCLPTQKEKSLALEMLSYEDFIQFSQELFDKVYLEGLIYGNCQEQEALTLCQQLRDALQAKPLPWQEIPKRKLRVLPESGGPFLLTEQTESMGKAAILTIQQGHFDFDTYAAQMILGQVLREAFFDALRTKQQTAYIAKASAIESEGHLLQTFIVHSNTHQPQELLARFDLFLEDLLQNFGQYLTPERFATLQAMLIHEMTMPPENLQKMAGRLQDLAFERNGDFAFYQKLIDALSKTQYYDIQAFAQAALSRKNTKRLAILVEGKLPVASEFSYKKLEHDEALLIGNLE